MPMHDEEMEICDNFKADFDREPSRLPEDRHNWQDTSWLFVGLAKHTRRSFVKSLARVPLLTSVVARSTVEPGAR